MKHLITLLYFVLFFQISNAQQVAWATSVGGTSGDYGQDVKVDAYKNVYTLGVFSYTADLDPGPGTLTITTNNGPNIFIVKQDSSGALVWASPFFGSGTGNGFELAIDDSGNVYSTGCFSSTVDFDPGLATFNLTSTGSKDAFISKLDSSGNFLWAKKIGGTGADSSRAISVDNNGNIYVTGVFSGTADFNPGGGVFNLTSNGSIDIYILKLDAAGNFQWAKQVGGPAADLSKSIEFIDNTQIVLCGGFQDTVDFDPGSGISNMISVGLFDVYIMSIDAAGNFNWAKTAGGQAGEIANSVSSDDNGNIYSTGIFFGTVDFDPSAMTYNMTSLGYGDIFILKLDEAGNFSWVKQIGGPNSATQSDNGYSIAVSENNNLFITGQFSSTVDFDPGPGVYNITASYGSGFICKLDSSGAFQYANYFAGGDGGIGYSIAVDANESSYITGGWWGSTIAFWPVPYLLTGHGDFDSFTVKYNNSPTGLSEPAGNNTILLFPNPVENILNIQSADIFKNAEIIITDILGKEITRSTINNASEFAVEFDQGAGVYLVNIVTDREKRVFRIIKK